MSRSSRRAAVSSAWQEAASAQCRSSTTTSDRPGVLRRAQQRQQLHARRERAARAPIGAKPAQDAQRHLTRQLVRLRPQHLTGRGQPGEDFAQQRGLPRPGRPFDPDHLGLARDRSTNAGRDRGKFGVAPDEGPLAHRPGTHGCILSFPQHDSTRGFP